VNFSKLNQLAYQNFLLAKYERFTGEILVKSYPYFIGIDPSSICQLRCPSCPTGVENESRRSGSKIKFRNRVMLTQELFDSLIDELGEYLFLIMFYNWGEPLLNKDLHSYIRKAKEFNIYTEIHTNLSIRISDQFIEELLCSGIDDIASSIDGFSQESYQTYRRGGNFGLVKENIERLAFARDKLDLNTNIIWNFLVFSFNEHEIEDTRRYCSELGIIFNQREAFIDNPDWLPSYRKHERSTLEKIKEDHNKSEQISNLAESKNGRKSSCAWHYSYSVVNADGSVSPCCAPWEQEHDFGTIKPGYISFADVWNNNYYRKSRGAFANKEVKGLNKIKTICLQCPFGQNIQDLYSPLDKEIINQFNRIFKDTEPTLTHAFDLLDYKSMFIDFFENNILSNTPDNREMLDNRKSNNSFLNIFKKSKHNLFDKGVKFFNERFFGG
jgi:MoaA/NifB/PqqE/SkfB family radical SAM enzyme